MKYSSSSIQTVLALTLAFTAQVNLSAQDHGHLNAGAGSTVQNSPLLWTNGADFITDSFYVKTLIYTNAGKYAGYFHGNITPTALPTTAAHAGPDPLASAPGSFLRLKLSCLEAPAGGTLGYWENGATAPTLSLNAGQTGTNLFPLSQSTGAPGLDPYGHIHGRRFTATKAGLYKIGFQAFDTCTNGVEGGPIHTPSEVLPVWFQAGVNIESVEPDEEEGHVHVRFGAQAGFDWQLEYRNELSPSAPWLPAGNPVTGADYFVEKIHELPPGEHRFYRVKGTLTPQE